MKKFIIQFILVLCVSLGFVDVSMAQMPSGVDTPAPLPEGDSTPTPTEENAMSFGLFGVSLYVGTILIGGIGSFALFLYLHKVVKSRYDWIWPLIPAIFAGYLVAFTPMWISGTAYEQWSAVCFDASTYGDNRDPYDENAGPYKPLCNEAQTGENFEHVQVSISALGLNTIFRTYKENFTGGIGQTLYPGEMHFLIWLWTAICSLAIYLGLLKIRGILVFR